MKKIMVRFAHRDCGEDDDALDYVELNASGDTCVRLRRLTVMYKRARFASLLA